MTRKYTDDQVQQAAALYAEGAPYDVIEQRTGINARAVRCVLQKRCPITRSRKVSWAWRERNAPWHLLAGIKPVKNPPRGYSTFTAEEGERIRAFCIEQQIPAAMVARHFGVSHAVMDNVVNRKIQYTRKARPTAAGKRKYAQDKAARVSGRPWVSAEQEVTPQ